MTNPLYSEDSNRQEATSPAPERRGSWLRMGAVAAASAVVGGLAAAWFYRKTLVRLQTVEPGMEDSKFRNAESPEDEI